MDAQVFILTPDQDVPALQNLIVAAIRPGGGFVTLDAVGRGRVSVLVTPHSPIWFETVPMAPESVTDEASPMGVEFSPSFDTDYFSEQFGL